MKKPMALVTTGGRPTVYLSGWMKRRIP